MRIILALAEGTAIALSDVQWPCQLITLETPYNGQVTGTIIENDRADLSTDPSRPVFLRPAPKR